MPGPIRGASKKPNSPVTGSLSRQPRPRQTRKRGTVRSTCKIGKDPNQSQSARKKDIIEASEGEKEKKLYTYPYHQPLVVVVNSTLKKENKSGGDKRRAVRTL